jgi:RHS repeat-associated protein
MSINQDIRAQQEANSAYLKMRSEYRAKLADMELIIEPDAYADPATKLLHGPKLRDNGGLKVKVPEWANKAPFAGMKETVLLQIDPGSGTYFTAASHEFTMPTDGGTYPEIFPFEMLIPTNALPDDATCRLRYQLIDFAGDEFDSLVTTVICDRLPPYKNVAPKAPVFAEDYPSAQQPVSAGLGYNGEFSEPQTGWQLLGNGYRAYNPRLMKFHSPDSLSPFGEGGVNAYAFCEGEPVLNVDLDGHSIWSWLKGYRSSTTQAYNRGTPKHFLQDSKGGAGVRTIRNKDVRRLGKVVKLRERELAETRNSEYEHSRDEIHVAEYELKHGKGRFLADAKKEMAEAGDILETASFLHGWAKSSVGELGFTKEGSMLLKIKALAYDKKAAAIRRQETQAYSQWQQDKMYRDNQERANAVGIPRANKRAHQAPNYRG